MGEEVCFGSEIIFRHYDSAEYLIGKLGEGEN